MPTAHRPVAYCVLKPPGNCEPKKGFTLIINLKEGFLELECQSVDLRVCAGERGEVYPANPSTSKVLLDPKVSSAVRQMSK